MQVSVVLMSPICNLSCKHCHSMTYYLHPQHSFHVIHPGLSIEPDFPLHGLTCTENPGMEPTYQGNTSYMQHLSTRGREISKSHQFEH